MIGVGLTVVPNMLPVKNRDNYIADGMVVSEKATDLAASWRPLIERDPNVRKMWERLVTGSGWGAVIVSHTMVAVAIASNHGLGRAKVSPLRAVPNEDGA